MNAYSSIGKRRTAVGRRLRSRAYRSGLVEGFGAPALFTLPAEYPRASEIDASIEGAWKAVGDALKAATKQGAQRIGKTTRKDTCVD